MTEEKIQMNIMRQFFFKAKTFLPCDSTNKKCQDKKGKVIIGGEKDSNRAKKV